MQLQIVHRKKNLFLKREEVEFEITGTKKTPTRKDVKEKIAALTNAKQEMLVLENIVHRFGSDTVFGQARIYDSNEALKSVEAKHVLARNFGKPKEEGQKGPKVPEQKKE